MGFLRKMIRLYLIVTVMGAMVLFFVVFRTAIKKDVLEKNMFLVDTSACRIPDLDPFDKSIIKLVKITGKIECGGKQPITFEDGNMLRINRVTVKNSYSGDLKSCKYQPIIRGPKKIDSNFQLGDATEFTNDTKIKNDFIKVQCTDKSDHTIYTNFHTFVIPSNDTNYGKKLKSHLKTNKPKEIINVMMIGVDSLSRLNFMRQMPLTRKYILEDLEAVEMLGYTKVADNTFVNIVPMTTGLFLEELPWNETLSGKPMDPYGYIWKNFSSCGYRTLYAEDAPEIAIFNYLKEGFHEQPADHYNRAFSIALEKETSIWHKSHHCVGDRLETDIVLNYVRQFSTTYHHRPHFGFTFITRLTHDSANSAGQADDPYHRFLQKIHEENLLENTILIFFSDHGMRFGDIRKTYVGKLEERMPYMFFVLPRWFKEKYPRIHGNMRINSHRLTTPFDIHETLLDILYFTGDARHINSPARGISLFHEVPENRTCESAGILPHWCMCLQTEDLPKTSESVNTSVDMVLQNINKKLQKDKDKCELLKLKEVKAATQMMANSDVLRFRESKNDVINRTVHYGTRTKGYAMLQLTIVTTPGGGMFEATVNYDETNNKYTMAGDISRINKYGNQSYCTDNFVLKKYCFCKKTS